MSKYLIDSNILINSNRFYKQKYFPVIWNFFKNNSDIIVIDKVFKELVDAKDELSKFIKDNYKNNTVDSNVALNEYVEVIKCVSDKSLWTDAGSEEWKIANKADPWLIAYAKYDDCIIITDENNKGPNGHPSNNEPKIPFVADKLGVSVINFWDLLEEKQFVAK